MVNNYDTGNRLKKFRFSFPSRCTQAELCDALGITQGTYSLYECGQRPISKTIKALLKEKYSLNLVWLETGKGEMFLENANDAICKIFAKLDEDNKNLVLEVAKMAYVSQMHSDELYS